MIRKLSLTIFVFLFCLFISNKIPVQAQGNLTSPAQSAQLWRCLQASQTGGQTDTPPPGAHMDLTGKGFPSFQDIFIVLCIPPKKGSGQTSYKCSTGNAEFDKKIFGSDLTSAFTGNFDLEVPVGVSPPQAVQANGDTIQTTARMVHAKGHVSYAFFGVTVSEPKVIPGQGSTIQYGTFEFQQDPKVQGCVSIRWDPFGRIFDSQSLEPISNAQVTLLDKNKVFADMQGLTNPEITEADGIYNFFVDIKGTDPETFYINPFKSTHTFISEPNMHPNFDRAYYDIYKPDEPIIEAPGVPEHRDIPLDPGTNPPFRSDPISMTAAAVRLGRYIRYEGFVSHPLSVVTLVGKNSQTEIARTNADKEGFWTILVPHDNVPQNEPLKMQIIKVDIMTLSWNFQKNSFAKKFKLLFSQLVQGFLSITSKSVSAQPVNTNDGTEFQPILSYVEGFAKDSNGNVIPNAIVNVKLEMSNGLYTQTTADENGFFTIAPERLPIFDYYIEVVAPNAAAGVKMSTVDFVKENEDHLVANNVNLMAATKNGESLLPPLPSPEVNQSGGNTEPLPPKTSPLFVGSNLNLILTVIALIVLLGVTGGVLMYIKKKKSESDDLL